ncbi:MAG: hypothetical protein GXO63_00220, partial [Candidatus Micrarchaeota archaeon]|nr:hypothetical protein [Candidatus Micrarchaeota archaeon]
MKLKEEIEFIKKLEILFIILALFLAIILYLIIEILSLPDVFLILFAFSSGFGLAILYDLLYTKRKFGKMGCFYIRRYFPKLPRKNKIELTLYLFAVIISFILG